MIAKNAGSAAKRADAREGKAPSRTGLFLRSAIPDFALCCAVAMGVGYAVLSGFDATLGMRGMLGLQFAVVGAMLAVLFAGSWSKGARAASVVGALALVVAVLTAAWAAMPDGVSVMADGGVNDVEGNYVVFATVELAVAVLCYAVSRRPGGAVFLAVAAVLACAVVQYLFRDWLSSEGGMAAFLVVACASLALAVYQRYRAGVASSDRLSSPAFGTALATGLAVAALCLGGAGLAYVGVIEPLGLGTPVIKPFEHRIVRPVVEYTGAYDQYQVEDPNKFSSLLSDDAEETSQNAEGGASPQEDSEDSSSSPLTSLVQSLTAFSEDSWSETFDAVTTERPAWTWALAVLGVLAACALVVLARVLWRTVRLRRIERMPAAEQAVRLYEFLAGRFARLGLGRPPQSTPLEYAYDFRRRMVPFTRGTGKVDLVRLTLAYQRAAYGTGDVTEDDLAAMKRYYRAFFGNARRYVGALRWLWKFWRI